MEVARLEHGVLLRPLVVDLQRSLGRVILPLYCHRFFGGSIIGSKRLNKFLFLDCERLVALSRCLLAFKMQRFLHSFPALIVSVW